MDSEKYQIRDLKELKDLFQRLWSYLELSHDIYKERLRILLPTGMIYHIAGILWLRKISPDATEDVAWLYHQFDYLMKNGTWDYGPR